MKEIKTNTPSFQSSPNRGKADTVPHPEVALLLKRLESIEPKEFANALYQMETVTQYPRLFSHSSLASMDQTSTYFARGLKFEVESIYLHLAHHLKAQSPGALELMQAVFQLFSKAMCSLPKLTPLNSSN